MNYRPLRMANLIREELAVLFLREMEFPGCLVTITDVNIDHQLERALVLVSVIPSAKADAALAQMNDRRGELQHQLNHKLNLKPMPRIEFEIDHGPENAARVEKILLDQ